MNNLLQKLGHYDITKLSDKELEFLVQLDQERRTVNRKAAQVKYGTNKSRKARKLQEVP
jgi:hypothetical protein